MRSEGVAVCEGQAEELGLSRCSINIYQMNQCIQLTVECRQGVAVLILLPFLNIILLVMYTYQGNRFACVLFFCVCFIKMVASETCSVHSVIC